MNLIRDQITTKSDCTLLLNYSQFSRIELKDLNNPLTQG